MSFSLLSWYRHKYMCEWHFSLLTVDSFEHGDEFERSLFSLGKKDEIWFLDFLWFRVLPNWSDSN